MQSREGREQSPYPWATLVTHCECGEFLRHRHSPEEGWCPVHGLVATPLELGWHIDETGVLRYKAPDPWQSAEGGVTHP